MATIQATLQSAIATTIAAAIGKSVGNIVGNSVRLQNFNNGPHRPAAAGQLGVQHAAACGHHSACAMRQRVGPPDIGQAWQSV